MEESIKVNSSWEEVKEKIKETSPDISDSDLVLNHGNEDEIFETLSKKLHKSKQEVKDWIESISSTKVIAG
ncbi:MAG: general stress protein CsbD [Bacteroidota bacterium]|nr:general stress protein CsbD [Bacteroidota bacterium]